MPFAVGPVLKAEMITTARRTRYYVARAVYGLILLGVLWELQRSWDWVQLVSRRYGAFWAGGVGGTPEELRRFAESAFIQFAGVQGFVLLCLIPALVAGVIADDYQRKTLHYLLASRLSSAEIVLGKLGARLLHVGSFVALGLPVVSLLSLYGGLNPEYVVLCYAGTSTTIFFAAGLSMVISVVADRPRDAVVAAYGLLAIWLWVPTALAGVAHAIGGPLFWVGAVNDWLLASNPMVARSELTRGSLMLSRFPAFFRGRFLGHFYEMAALQTGAGLFFLLLAIAGLRPLRGSTWPVAKPKSGWGPRLLRLARSIGRSSLAAPLLQNEILARRRERPPCGDRPMLWKERHARPRGGLRWLSSPIVLIFCSVALGCYFLDVIQPIISEIIAGSPTYRQRTELNVAVRESSIVLTILAMVTVAASASVSVTGEREGDTWSSLATTLLTPGEIIGAKQFGALWNARLPGTALLIVWLMGLLLGGIDPWGFVAASAITLAGAYFVAALGVFISARAQNGNRALLATFLLMFAAGWNWPGLLWQSLALGLQLAGPRFDLSAIPAIGGLPTSFGSGLIASFYAGGAGALTYLSVRRLRALWRVG
jgi:ABC-type transport system involved in multi-copper enzyme maturation permease subunit